jgi:hypothetical protein
VRGKPGTVKRPEAERAIRQLTHDWAAAHGVQPGSAEMPSFSAFHRWVLGLGGAALFQFRSTLGPLADAESWFDQELRQAWRN